MTSIDNDKKTLRGLYKARREALSEAVRSAADTAVCERLAALSELDGVRTAAGYLSDGTEPDLNRFFRIHLARGGRLVFPRSGSGKKTECDYEMATAGSLERNWRTGAYGLREPDETHPVHPKSERNKGNGFCWLVPGVAFTESGCRLGRGKSVYDRLMADSDALRIGIFYDCQEADTLPESSHDLRLDVIVTESRVIRCAEPPKHNPTADRSDGFDRKDCEQNRC